ncbi:hypothetical protein D7223_31495 [Micromonospora endolithica]|uniref:Bacterial transcriptional activator domain-containing protein n=1 Tax=Micromonospora endolithica TaxID=230091 RepID=A0A3A9YQK8_9ACTN|nr:hypothetical protein D7223_31495 [Micromonospora endolithica]
MRASTATRSSVLVSSRFSAATPWWPGSTSGTSRPSPRGAARGRHAGRPREGSFPTEEPSASPARALQLNLDTADRLVGASQCLRTCLRSVINRCRRPCEELPVGLCTNKQSPATPSVRLRLLGGFVLLNDDTPVRLSPGPQRVVALIAARGRTARSDAARVLWPRRSVPQAQAELRTFLWRLRQLPFRTVRTDAQYLCLDAAVSCDLHELRVEAEAWQQWAADRRQPQRRRLDGPGTAVHLHELCRDLLPGWYDDWVLAERDALQRIRVPLLRHLARTYKEAGEYGNALQAALHLVDMDPLDEQAQDMLIRIHVAEGNLVEARRAYTAYHSRLTAELGMTPPAALRRLAYPPANE